MLAEHAFVARQPICDRAEGLAAYELLFRSRATDRADVKSAEAATATVSVQAVMDIGLDDLVGSKRAWINLPRLALTDGHYRFLPPDRVVLEVLETVNADADVLHALGRARELGYQIALDDYVRNHRTSGLLDYADYVKVDVLGRTDADIIATYKDLARPGVRLLAEKVESRAVHDVALQAGYDLFQGYYFARPELVQRHRLPSDRNALLRLLSELQDPATPLERIETLIAADVGLSVRLVRYVNTAMFGVRQRIESLRHAVVMLGIDRLRECVAMLLLAGLDGKPSQLVTLALVRARMCEMLGGRKPGTGHRHFSAGLLSLLDAFLDQPLDDIVQQMGLTDDLNDALLRREGDLGSSLRVAEACERAEWDVLDRTDWDSETLRNCYMEAMSWTGRVQSILAAH